MLVVSKLFLIPTVVKIFNILSLRNGVHYNSLWKGFRIILWIWYPFCSPFILYTVTTKVCYNCATNSHVTCVLANIFSEFQTLCSNSLKWFEWYIACFYWSMLWQVGPHFEHFTEQKVRVKWTYIVIMKIFNIPLFLFP